MVTEYVPTPRRADSRVAGGRRRRQQLDPAHRTDVTNPVHNTVRGAIYNILKRQGKEGEKTGRNQGRFKKNPNTCVVGRGKGNSGAYAMKPVAAGAFF